MGRIQDALNAERKSVNGSSVLVIGVAYKKDVSDVRESPSLDIIRLLQEKGATVSYHDPHVARFVEHGLAMNSVEDLETALKAADCVVIATNHSAYDWKVVRDSSALLVDTRHVA